MAQKKNACLILWIKRLIPSLTKKIIIYGFVGAFFFALLVPSLVSCSWPFNTTNNNNHNTNTNAADLIQLVSGTRSTISNK